MVIMKFSRSVLWRGCGWRAFARARRWRPFSHRLPSLKCVRVAASMVAWHALSVLQK